MRQTDYHGACRPRSVVSGARYRFTILTSRLIRMEYSQSGIFEDRPSQLAINRDFETPLYSVHETSGSMEIHTEHLSLFYDKGRFSPGGLAIKVRSAGRGIYSTWHYSDELKENLGGTIRTLDQADGAVLLDPGIQSRFQGYSVLDDSATLLLEEDGWIEPRRPGTEDLYFFGYGFAYQECLQDFFHLSGETPLLPRYALGNWWSRFYPYTAAEYCALMSRFAEEQIPLSVAVLDMNWHITDVDPKDGKGWTGYTWNRNLIPEPQAFLAELHRRGLKVTLNLHPADGIQAHEAQYAAAAKDLGRVPESREPIPSDFCNRAFVKVYFRRLIQPLEQDGVDFWWIDWQQETEGRMPGSDPLWLLNHFHFIEDGYRKVRPMILSRYAGPGSHRYPIGFSGDSVISWASLRFQPYMTATAANIGFAWWSHDIGGHCGGKKDAELMTRWVQFGTFSPIMRLHSTSNLFNGKEPWKFGEPASGIMKRYLLLRHQLIPYLYSLNWHCHTDSVPPVLPMYYRYPKQDEAYEVPNQYQFGDPLIVCPITAPADAESGLGHTAVWLPEGMYFDFFTGLRYQGGRKLNIYRVLAQMPVFAHAGAIIPLTDETEASQNGVKLPKKLVIKIFNGESGHFTLYEDDGVSMAFQEGAYACTEFDYDYPNAAFTILPDRDPYSIRPARRRYTLCFLGATDVDDLETEANGRPISFTKRYDSRANSLMIELNEVDSGCQVQLQFQKPLPLAHNPVQEYVFDLLDQMNIGYEEKERVYRCICHTAEHWRAISELQAMELPRDVLTAISEVLLAE
ncbi:Alpha-glucosidase, glycosyl hydrolase family GH31 [Lachnospiraceae bacterium NK3A20]|nr:Alpha-glucosidase, glycosyl hydrolase family GH31 [Lachnospiraceae bacterium NK3A20]